MWWKCSWMGLLLAPSPVGFSNRKSFHWEEVRGMDSVIESKWGWYCIPCCLLKEALAPSLDFAENCHLVKWSASSWILGFHTHHSCVSFFISWCEPTWYYLWVQLELHTRCRRWWRKLGQGFITCPFLETCLWSYKLRSWCVQPEGCRYSWKE